VSRPGLDTHPLELQPDWFNTLFAEIGIDAEVRGFTAKSIGTGQIGENVRFVFDYARAGTNAPKTLVGKFPSGNEISVATAKMLNHYKREVMFYRTFPKVAGRITPDALYTDYDPETNRFVLIMEDMSPSEQGDQLKGCGAEEARLAMLPALRLSAAASGVEGSAPAMAASTASRASSSISVKAIWKPRDSRGSASDRCSVRAAASWRRSAPSSGPTVTARPWPRRCSTRAPSRRAPSSARSSASRTSNGVHSVMIDLAF
jgi:hypothetical protein